MYIRVLIIFIIFINSESGGILTLNFWKNLKKYHSIPEIKKKYNQLKEAQSRKDILKCCFKCKDDLTSPLRHTKKGMICKDCQENEQIRYYDYTEEDMDNMRVHTQTTCLYKGKRVTAKTKRNYV